MSEKIKNTCVNCPLLSSEINDIIKELFQQIEKMKCCANCEHDWYCNDSYTSAKCGNVNWELRK